MRHDRTKGKRGTRSAYTAGCRCKGKGSCSNANNKYMRDRRAEKKLAESDVVNQTAKTQIAKPITPEPEPISVDKYVPQPSILAAPRTDWSRSVVARAAKYLPPGIATQTAKHAEARTMHPQISETEVNQRDHKSQEIADIERERWLARQRAIENGTLAYSETESPWTEY